MQQSAEAGERSVARIRDQVRTVAESRKQNPRSILGGVGTTIIVHKTKPSIAYICVSRTTVNYRTQVGVESLNFFDFRTLGYSPG